MTTTERLCALLCERHEIGLKKYSVTLDRKDLTPEQWIQHAVEEMLDAAGYLMRLKDTITEMRRTLSHLNAECQKRFDDNKALQESNENLRDVAENLYHELNDLTPEKDCKCIPHGELCKSCRCESARNALRAWENMK